jgi:hypothetical protein
MSAIQYGKKHWAFAGGYIPIESNGREPEYVSKDTIAILNTTNEEATVHIMFYFTDSDPIGGFEIKVKGNRLRQFNLNDLIDPQAIPLGVPYGGLIESNVPVVVQLTKQHTGQSELALMGLSAYSRD